MSYYHQLIHVYRHMMKRQRIWSRRTPGSKPQSRRVPYTESTCRRLVSSRLCMVSSQHHFVPALSRQHIVSSTHCFVPVSFRPTLSPPVSSRSDVVTSPHGFVPASCRSHVVSSPPHPNCSIAPCIIVATACFCSTLLSHLY